MCFLSFILTFWLFLVLSLPEDQDICWVEPGMLTGAGAGQTAQQNPTCSECCLVLATEPGWYPLHQNTINLELCVLPSCMMRWNGTSEWDCEYNYHDIIWGTESSISVCFSLFFSQRRRRRGRMLGIEKQLWELVRGNQKGCWTMDPLTGKQE